MKKIIIFFFLLVLLIAGCSRKGLQNDLRIVANEKEIQTHSSYYSDKFFFKNAYKDIDNAPENNKVYGAIFPHHLLAAKNIAALFNALREQNIKTVAIVGPDHFNAGDDILVSKQPYSTPYGNLDPDKEAIGKLLNSGFVKLNEEPFEKEHSISSLVAFVKNTFPDAKLVPIIIKNGVKAEVAEQLGYKLSKYLPEESLVIASCDFAHHTDYQTAVNYNQESLEAIKKFNFDDIFKINVDSPSSIYALLAYLKQKNAASFNLTANTNAAVLLNDYDYKDVTSYILGYFTAADNETALQKQEASLKMLFFGDMMLDRHVGEKIKKQGIDYIFTELAGEENSFFKGIDIISCNLEGAVTDKGEHYAPANGYDFAFAPDLIGGLKKYNFNFFNLANNHFFDQGERGIMETRKNLNALGLDYAGCQDGQTGDCSFKIVQVADKKIGMAGFSMVYKKFDLSKAEKIIKDLASATDLVIVNIHWGVEYQHRFNKLQQETARKLVDAGADMIIGHHPHVVQGIEIYNGKPIFYSLGNFIFDQYFSADTEEGLSVGINANDKQIEIFLYPLKSKLSQVELMAGEDKKKFLEKFVKWSKVNEEYAEQVKEGRLFLSF